MRKLLEYANEYVKQSDWKTLALLKFCLFSMGLMVGQALPRGAKKPVLIVSSIVFTATYVPLMMKLLRIAEEDLLKDYTF